MDEQTLMTKPMWANLAEEAHEMEQSAIRLRQRANETRCTVLSDGNVRCSRDAEPQHEHGFRLEDLPAHQPISKGA